MKAVQLSSVMAVLAAAALAAPALGQAQLYAVTGDGGSTPESLFTLDMTTGTPTAVRGLGNGSDGEEIAYHPVTGMIYHLSGRGDVAALNAATGSIFESIDPVSLVVTPIPLATGFTFADPLFAEEAKGFTYDPATGAFLAGDLNFDLYRLNLDGTSVRIGAADHLTKGLAFVGSTLYSLDNDFGDPAGARLRTLDPATGATLTTVTVVLPGFSIVNGIALAANPDDGRLWAVVSTAAQTPSGRRLVTIDPATGIATLIGSPSLGIAGITFVAGGAPPACACETDGNTAQVDVFDLLAFLDLWFVGDAGADIDGTPGVDVFDLLFFLDCWFPASAGTPCP